MKKGMILILTTAMVTGLGACGGKSLSVSDSVSGRSISIQSIDAQSVSAQAVSVSDKKTGLGKEKEEEKKQEKQGKKKKQEQQDKKPEEQFRYVSKDCFYTDFEGKSMVQTDEVEADTICQRSLSGKLLHSYPMGEKFEEIFYVDENWLYYVELAESPQDVEMDIYRPVIVYRAPLIHKDGEEIPEFSKKEFVFKESGGLGGSDFSENPFLQLVDDTIYYYACGGLGTYDLKSKKQKHYPIKALMNAAGTKWIISEGKKQSDVLTDRETGKSKVMKTEAHPWLRLGKEYYFRHPYSSFRVGDLLLLDLNSGETMKVLSRGEGKRIAQEMGIPLEGDCESDNNMLIDYIGYYDQRVYAEIRYFTAMKDKKGRKYEFMDAVCVSRDMDREKGWRIEREITAYGRKGILKCYKQVVKGSYKPKKGEDWQYTVDIGEGVANGIFYFVGNYKKDGKQAKDIYDLKKKEFRVIGRNSPETFYPFYDNSHSMTCDMHNWQGILALAPIMSQGETLWDQEQKRKNP